MANTNTNIEIEVPRDAVQVQQDGTLLIKNELMSTLVQSGVKAMATHQSSSSQIQPMISISIK